MDKILDIQIYKTATGFTIQSEGYHKALPEGNVLPCENSASSEDSLYKQVIFMLGSQMRTQRVLDEKGLQGFKDMLEQYKPLDKNLTLS